MNIPGIVNLSDAFLTFDQKTCLLFNKACRKKYINKFFSIISRLGDGVFWYGLMFLIPFLFGVDSLHVSIRMAIVGAISLAVYKLIKSSTERLRPFMVNPNIMAGTRPLDKYSFPSGHTLHATSFSITSAYFIPELAWIVIPFAVLVAISRIILGLHYPTDVLAGIILGTGISVIIISF